MRIVKSSIRYVASHLGYEIRRKVPSTRRNFAMPEGLQGYDLEQEAYDNIAVVRLHTMLPYVRLVSLYQQVVFCEINRIRGSFVECGTWKGGAVGLMALGNIHHGSGRRHIHLFDSFQGIPEPDEEHDDANAIAAARKVGGGTKGRLIPLVGTYDSVGTLEVNKTLLEGKIGYDSCFLHYHQGWFQDTLPRAAEEMDEIAILRLDGDWYASTKICLESLYDKVVAGGFVIIDDYGHNEGCKQAVHNFFNRSSVKPFLHHIDCDGRYWIKP